MLAWMAMRIPMRMAKAENSAPARKATT